MFLSNLVSSEAFLSVLFSICDSKNIFFSQKKTPVPFGISSKLFLFISISFGIGIIKGFILKLLKKL
jgi:hypothetical protein